MLFRLSYYSEAAERTSSAALNEILEAAERNNRLAGVTGCLLFSNDWFLQVLEGDRQVLSNVLARLYQDKRHRGLTIIDARAVIERMFNDWWMGAAAIHGIDREFLRKHGMEQNFDPRRLEIDAVLMMALGSSHRLVSRVQ